MADYEEDKPRHECGVFGVYGQQDAARSIFFALYALQHRGQESAGICTSHMHQFHLVREMGLVSQVFTEAHIATLKGRLGIGHTRYSTAGGCTRTNAQPFLIETDLGRIAVAHNGQVTTQHSLKKHVLSRGTGLFTNSDSELIAQMLAIPTDAEREAVRVAVEVPSERAPTAPTRQAAAVGSPRTPRAAGSALAAERAPRIEKRIAAFMQAAEGAFSVVVLTRDAVYGFRDRHGIRPLCIGERYHSDGGGKAYFLSSESCALGTIGATKVRDVLPGEIVRLDADGIHSRMGLPATLMRSVKPALCVFEHVYFARPDSVIADQLVHAVRQRLGAFLWRDSPIEADIVSGVPDSSTAAAVGLSVESGIPYQEVLCKNRYIGRTFIHPDDEMRRNMIQLKFNALARNIAGKRLILVDDSIVRGNTLRQLVPLLREAGAAEVHIRITSPQLLHPCFMGVDIGTHEQLIAHRLGGDVDRLCRHMGADSLAFISHDSMMRAVRDLPPAPGKASAGAAAAAGAAGAAGAPGGKAAEEVEEEEGDVGAGFCSACFTGKYPLTIEEW